jgi:hypothetical protein
MATAAGIILTAGGITLANDALNAPYTQGATSVVKSINWRVIPATAVAALIFAGIEQVNGQLGRGLAYIALVTTLIVPLGTTESPIEHLVTLMGYTGKVTS